MAQSLGLPKQTPRGRQKHIKEDDLFVCSKDGKAYKVSWALLKILFQDPPPRWHLRKSELKGPGNYRENQVVLCHGIDSAWDLDTGKKLSGPAEVFHAPIAGPKSDEEWWTTVFKNTLVVGYSVRFFNGPTYTEPFANNWHLGEETNTKSQYSFDYMFYNCAQLEFMTESLPSGGEDRVKEYSLHHMDVTDKCIDMSYAFAGTQIKSNANRDEFKDWDTKNVVSFRGTFRGRPSRNGSFAGSWRGDLRKCPKFVATSARDIDYMYSGQPGCHIPGPDKGWGLENVETARYAFSYGDYYYRDPNRASGFEHLRFGKVKTLEGFMDGTREYTFNASGWDVSTCTNFRRMFYSGYITGEGMGNWDMSNATDTSYMFHFTTNFNPPTDTEAGFYKWNLGNVTMMDGMLGNMNPDKNPIKAADMRGWCVSKISERPTDWGYMAPLHQIPWTMKEPNWGTCPPQEQRVKELWNLEHSISLQQVQGTQRWIQSDRPVPAGGKRELVVTTWHGSLHLRGDNQLSQDIADAGWGELRPVPPELGGGNDPSEIIVEWRKDVKTVSYTVKSPEHSYCTEGFDGLALVVQAKECYFTLDGNMDKIYGQLKKEWVTYQLPLRGVKNKYSWTIDTRCDQFTDAGRDPNNVCPNFEQAFRIYAVVLVDKKGGWVPYNKTWTPTEMNQPAPTVKRIPIADAVKETAFAPGALRVKGQEEDFDSNGNSVRLGLISHFDLDEDAYMEIS